MNRSETAPPEAVVRVLSWNVWVRNPHVERIESTVLSIDPDVLLLMEVRPGLVAQLAELQKAYPYRLVRESWGGQGIAMFTRVADTELQLMPLGVPGRQAIVARLPATADHREIHLVGLHAYSPIPLVNAAKRDLQLATLAAWASEQSTPLCVFGDYNITPWTRGFRRLLSAGLTDTRCGSGNWASWPADLRWLGIPIDHVLTRGCVAYDRQALAVPAGSDHLPVVFRLHRPEADAALR